MSKVQHQSLVGTLAYDEETGYSIDGFSVEDVLDAMMGLDVHLEVVGYQTNQKAEGKPASQAPSTDFLKKLLGSDPDGSNP